LRDVASGTGLRKRNHGAGPPVPQGLDEETQVAGLLATVIGSGAAICSMTSFAPQLVKILKERDASGVSLRMFALTVVGFSLWSTYGVLLRSWPIVASNLVCLALSAAILAAKWRFSGRHDPGEL
jgi:MtN3 and saliva related transmembrane protein